MPDRHPDYDGDLQMFREPPRELDLAHAQFYRWLAAREGGAARVIPAEPEDAAVPPVSVGGE